MGKKFFDVFPTLKLDTGLKDLYEQVTVEKVSSTKRKDFLRVYISSDRLIQKEDVFRAEGEIKKQFFPNVPMVIKFYERFHLSSQYDPKKLMEIYRDSILLELREYSPVEYNLFKKADITFAEDNNLLLTVEDTVLGKGKAEELIRILEKVYNERCGFAVTVQVAYKEHITGKYKEEDEHRLAMQVAEISARAGYARGGQHTGNGDGLAQEEPYADGRYGSGPASGEAGMDADQSFGSLHNAGMGSGEETAQGSGVFSPAAGSSGQKEGAPGMQGQGASSRYTPKMPYKAGRKGDQGKKADFRKALKRSDNPDVLYGRDFEEEAMPISDIIGEMGEVVIRGRILNMDKREIKNERTILIFDVTDFSDTMTIKLFLHNDQAAELTGDVKPGVFVKIKGMTVMDKFDHELTIGSLTGIKKIPDFTTSRMDTSVRKRVELHCHTK